MPSPILPVTTPITGYGAGTPLATDVTVYTDTLDTTQAAAGTTKKYQRGLEFNYYFGAAGIDTVVPVQVATTTNLNATYNNGLFGVGATLTSNTPYGLLIIDGLNVQVGWRVLVWNQSNSEENGIYVVTVIGTSFVPWVLTRATDYDTPPQIILSQIVLVEQGNTLANVCFQQTASGPFVIGSTGIVFQRFDILNSAFVIFPTWINVTSPTVNMVAGQAYIANNTGSPCGLALPVISPVGTTLNIAGASSSVWVIAQNAGQSINFGTLATTVGPGGQIFSSHPHDSISMVCVTANTTWTVYGSIGNLNYV